MVPWDNFDATVEMGEPNPGPGTDGDDNGCNSQDGWCNITDYNEPGVQSSIWYTFKATSNCVTISTISIDNNIYTQLALWGLSDGDKKKVCPGPHFSNLVEIAASDDSGPIGVGDPIIQSATVTKGQVYYTQLDGTDGVMGSGTISFSDCAVRTEQYQYCPQPGAGSCIFFLNPSHVVKHFPSDPPFSHPKPPSPELCTVDGMACPMDYDCVCECPTREFPY
jgi:hypothetical protein